MLSDEDMIRLMVSEPSWEDVLVKIIAEEGMDPWSIDIVKLTESFLSYLEKADEKDLKIPARFILIAAILLRMKSDILSEEKRVIVPESPDNPQEAEMLRALAAVQPLQPPVKRVPMKNVTLQELITALKKAFEVRERRVERKLRIRRAVAHVLVQEEDITDRINKLLGDINSILDELETSKIEFSKLVKIWERKEIVSRLMPMLHLAQDGKISCDQPELFKEIYIERKKNEQPL